MSEEKKETTKDSKEYRLVEVPTQMGIAIASPNDEALSTEQALVEILNKLSKLEKALV